MADPVFRSKLRNDIEAFIVQKRAAGYPYLTSAKVLGYLDSMIAESYPDSDILSKEICNTWLEECSKLHQNTLLRRVTPVRQLGKYIILIDTSYLTDNTLASPSKRFCLCRQIDSFLPFV